MGKVIVSAVVENLADLMGSKSEKPRRVHLNDVLIDGEAFGLLMPMNLIDQLGLEPLTCWNGASVYRAARLTVHGRDCILDVTASNDESHVTIGRPPLSLMDWVIDLEDRRLIGNPAHGGEEMIEAY